MNSHSETAGPLGTNAVARVSTTPGETASTRKRLRGVELREEPLLESVMKLHTAELAKRSGSFRTTDIENQIVRKW
jgi:hypothetical protein